MQPNIFKSPVNLTDLCRLHLVLFGCGSSQNTLTVGIWFLFDVPMFLNSQITKLNSVVQNIRINADVLLKMFGQKSFVAGVIATDLLLATLFFVFKERPREHEGMLWMCVIAHDVCEIIIVNILGK